jgi:hypothetical protein
MRFFPISTRFIDVIYRVEGTSFFNKTNENTTKSITTITSDYTLIKNDGIK